jgi:catechol 2,3-dioxygenase-like lactoylglutathione lyase family enzyme
MLKSEQATATIGVKDLEMARGFYEDTLGLRPRDTGQAQVVLYKTGRTSLLVYKSEFGGTNKATSATWPVDDVDSLVDELKERGVRFERYDIPGCEHQGDVHVRGSWRGAWFKDPEGNIHHLVKR